MMTEAVVTPWISDRDLALQNVRYVFNAAGNLREDFRPSPDGFIAQRARQVLGEAVDLLDAHRRRHPARRDRRRHVRPHEAPCRRGQGPRRRGAQGVRLPQPGDRPARGGGDAMSARGRARTSCVRTATPQATAWCRCRSRCRCRTTSAPRARPSCSRTRWAWTPRWWCTPRRWARTSPSSSSTARCTTSSTCAMSSWSSATTRCSRRRRSTALIKKSLRRPLVVVGACIGTDAHTVGIDAILNIKGFAGEKGLEYYSEITVVNLGAQVAVPDLVEQARAAQGRRRPRVAGGDPARRAPAQHPRDERRVPRGVPRRRADRCSSSAVRASTSSRPPSSASTASSDAARPRARSRPTSSRPSSTEPHPAEEGLVSQPTDDRASRRHRHAPPLRPLLARALRRQPRRRRLRARACSATSRPSCASAPTATRGCSPATTTSRSARR